MRRTIASLLSSLVLAVAVVATAQETGAGGAEGNRPECVSASAVPRMQAFGWNHVVVVRNTCSAPVDCRVASDVDPTPIAVRVPAGQTVETATRRGSPASVFVARADCALAR